MKFTTDVYYALLLATVLLAEAIGFESISDNLVKEVFDSYEPDVRPICGPYPSPVLSTLGIAVRQLVEISEPEQKMSTSIWFRLKWSDCRLAWNESDFGGIERVILPKHRVWVPDLTLYDNAESKLGEQDEYRVVVDSSGGVRFQLPAVVVSMCQLNVAHFPFDVQTCYLTLGSWTYNTRELQLYARWENPDDLSAYIPHGEWDLFGLDPENTTISSSDGSTDFAQVQFTFHLRRRPLFHIVSLILPSIIVKALAVVGFILPPESGEKLNLSVTTLLSLLVFQLVILETMPHTSENMPILAIYFVLAMVLIALSCLSTVFVLNVHFSKHHTPLPMWLRKILTSRLGWLFRVDHLIITAHEKYQRLQAEYSHYRPRQSQPQQCTSPSHKNLKRQPSYRTKSFIGRLPLSPRGRKSMADEDDSIYGFYPSNGHANLTAMRPPAGHEYSDSSKPRVISTSFFSMSNDNHLQESEPKPGDTPGLAITRRILAQLEKINAYEMKKCLSDVQEQEWNIFAVFLDRIFLLLFLILGVAMAMSVYCIIST